MNLTAHAFALFAPLFAPPIQDDAPSVAVAQAPFPTSTALAEEVSPEALERLDQLIETLVDEEEIVGAELLVIKNGRSILHEAYGWSDRESQTPMETGSVFCVRSMTKPVIGAAILMLIEDKAFALDDRIAQYLPSFDVEGSREITIEHLLMHTSGLPMSLILGKNLSELESIRSVADLGGGHELAFEPGSDFSYSDQGTDTLTALIEIASGMPAEDFVRTRVLEPLGMENSTCLMGEDHPLRARAIPKYTGSRGNWTRFWSPEDAPLFPIFLGSQGLYSTLEDYARFMDLWTRRGRVGKERLLSARHVRKALTPNPHPFPGPTGLPEASAGYGYLMQLWTQPGEPGEDGAPGDRELVAFGHTGSDGTHAWTFPEEKAMVLFFTQSRNTSSGLRVEEALGELFLGAPFDPNEAAPPFEEYLGYYWEGPGDLYRAIIRDGEDLALEILGKGVVALSYTGEDRWKIRQNPSVVLAFQRSDDGLVTGYHIGDHEEYRFEPSPDLPDADDLARRVAAAHRLDLIETLGPIRIHNQLTIEKLGMSGEVSILLQAPDRFRYDTALGEQVECAAFNGERVMYSSSTQSATVLDGARGESVRRDNPFARLGDWHRWYPELQVIQRIEEEGEEVFVVRAGGTDGPASTLYVHGDTARLLMQDSLVYTDGLGRIGQRMEFQDFRDVSGMLLPHRGEIEMANPLIGTVVTEVTEIELGVEVEAAAFELEE